MKLCDDEEEEIEINGFVPKDTVVIFCNDVEAYYSILMNYLKPQLIFPMGSLSRSIAAIIGPDFKDSVKRCLLLAVIILPKPLQILTQSGSFPILRSH